MPDLRIMSTTQLPLRLYRPLHREILNRPLSSRCFSSTPTLARKPRDGRKGGRVDTLMAATAARHQHGRPSSAVQEEQLSDERNVPDDIGLIPGTFVHAPLFPLTRFSFTERLWYEWKWATSRATAWYQLWRFKRSFSMNKPHMYWLYWLSNRKQLHYKALQKYRHLYESFASADSKEISRLCASGVAKKFQNRIDSRPPGVQMQWEVEGEPSCRIVSNVASPLSLPGYEETGIHQVILHIRSKQRVKLGGSQKSSTDSVPWKHVEEYLVLQRQFIRGSHKEWAIWGFTEFSTPNTIERGEEYARRVNAFQAA